MIDRIALQLERLRRHYDTAVNTYDEISLLELSHTLRIWTEIKNSLKIASPKFYNKKVFKTATPARKIQRAARGYEHILAYMPGGVVTYASNGNFLSGPQGNGENLLLSAVIRVDGGNKMEMRNFHMIFGPFDLSLEYALKEENIARRTFSQWLESEVVRLAYKDEVGALCAFSISREVIIKRVANTLDGSHYSGSENMSSSNRYNAPVNYLLKYQAGGLPIPYFILLKIAQDILQEKESILSDR